MRTLRGHTVVQMLDVLSQTIDVLRQQPPGSPDLAIARGQLTWLRGALLEAAVFNVTVEPMEPV